MMGSYFNEHSELKFELAPYTCEHCPKPQSFDNADELQKHVLQYHDFNTRFANAKKMLQDYNYAQHAEEHCYNYASFSFFGYIIIEARLFNMKLNSCIDFENDVNLVDRILLPRNTHSYDIT